MNTALKEFLRNFFPRTIRSWRILSGPLRGSYIVSSWHDYPAAILGRTELPLLQWFEKNVAPGETWLDIGAHYGYTAISLSRLVGPLGRVYAFEPMISTAGFLTQTRDLNKLTQLTVLAFALGDPKELELIQLPVVRGMASSNERAEEKVETVETIFVTRFDWLWPRICEDREQIHGIKIDVQGMEINVIRGYD
jgi:FkbM family methyltransferase